MKLSNMEKYNQFISETTTSVFEKEEHKARLEYLIKVVAPLIEESSKVYPQVSKYKRCTRLTDQFREAWGKIFEQSIKQELPPPKKERKLDQYSWYIYTPDGDTRPNFIKAHKGRQVQFVGYVSKSKINTTYADSISNPNDCICQVGYFEPYRGKFYFWTREQCLKKRR